MGTTVTVASAWDADEWGGDSWQVDYRLESGNEEEVFTLVTDRQTNEAALILDKVSFLPQYYCRSYIQTLNQVALVLKNALLKHKHTFQ